MDGKKCTKCGEVKPLDEFSKNSRNNDGLNYRCRECDAVYQREWRSKNREKQSEYNHIAYMKRKLDAVCARTSQDQKRFSDYKWLIEAIEAEKAIVVILP